MDIFWAVICIGSILTTVAGQSELFEEIESFFDQRGIPYREEKFLRQGPILPEYDFVIVGSGPAGSAIANRLTEIANWTVLLLEKGGEGTLVNDIPFVNAYTVLGPCCKIYPVERQPSSCTGLEGRRCHWPTGNCVGGATIINGMMNTRGHPSDYNRWANDGNPGWSYEELLPYFIKLENMSISSLANSGFHGRNGPVHIDYPFQTSVGKRFVKAGQELGYDIVDYNDPNTMMGFSGTQVTQLSGKRSSAASSYLLPVRGRNNLHISKDTLVTKVLIDPQTKRAFGVNFIKNNIERTVKVRKEVILSAGAFGSPQLLLLSGVGPQRHLQEMNIPVMSNLPVGYNLQEHIGTPAMSFLINTTDSVTLPKLSSNLSASLLQWVEGNGGILSNNVPEAIGYIKTPLADQIPDIELIFLPLQLAADGGLFRNTLFITDEVFYKTWAPILLKEGFTISPMVMYPRSRGVVKLKTTNPRDPPLIKSNFFTDPYDVRVIIEGVRAALAVANTNTFQEIGTTLFDYPVHGCEHFIFNSDGYWDCVIRHIPIQFHHQCGTCRMGPNPNIAVVDPRLRVHGISGLRVADSSIMPYIPGVHTMTPCYLIGEKAADLIKEDWNV